MIFVIGGVFEGKKQFAEKQFSLLDDEILDGEKCDFEAVFSAKCVNNCHNLIKRLINNKIDPIEFTREIILRNSGLILIMDEIGCGIIPIERDDREYRELVGKCGCIIAEKSEAVIRIFCGIPNVIKGEI